VQAENQESSAADLEMQRKVTLELLFISFTAITMISAFIAALTYDFVSARAPLCILVPLLILTGVQFNRTRRRAGIDDLSVSVTRVVQGKDHNFNRVTGFIGLMTLLLLLIYVAGHYVGISVFMFVLLYLMSNERLLLSLALAVGVTIGIYFLFEHGFNIELYRGVIFRLLSRDDSF